MRSVSEEYLLRLGTNETQVEAIKYALGIDSSLTSKELFENLTYPSKRLDGIETKLEEHHYQYLLHNTPTPNYTKNTLSGTWFKVSNFFGELLAIAGKDQKYGHHETQLFKLINDLCPLDALSKEYVNVTLLIPNQEIKGSEESQHHELEGYNAKWQWYKLRKNQVKSQIESDPTWSLKLFLAFSFMGLANTSIDKKNGSKLLYGLLNTSNSLNDFHFYDSALYRDWIKTNGTAPERVDNIFTQTLNNSAYLTVSDKIANAVDEPSLVKLLALPSVELNTKKQIQFASTSALKDRGSKDPSHFINSAKNIRLALNYLFCMTSGTAITLQIPIEPVGAKMKHWQLNTPLIIAPIEWVKLIEGMKKKKTGKRRENYDASALPTNEDGSAIQYRDLENISNSEKHKAMSDMLAKTININDDADTSGQLDRSMPNIEPDEEW
ncbi:hypothetical protein ACFSJY_02645 [Thalassotalea euphylliae]|uniref:hypothetical protein n=1 Tax=Thalassotalea euphylliae TaxID=1655234 RepID=UPI00363087CB